jgi:arylsulfatase
MSEFSMTRRQWMGLSAAALAATSIADRTEALAAERKRPNILLLMADQYRGDCLGADSNTAILTPHLDRIAREGARFCHAYSCVPSCTPARAVLLTGLGPWRNGMPGYGKIPEQYPKEMPRMLADAGYHTCAIGKCHFTPQRNGHGFHQLILDESGRVQDSEFKSDYRAWFASVAPHLNPDATGIGWNDYLARPYALPEELHPTRWTGDVAVNFINGYAEDAPFFLKVSFARPHSPYDTPQRFLDLYKDRPIPERHLGDWCGRYEPRSGDKDDIWHGDMGADRVRHSRMAYYGNVSFVDEQIGRILAALEGQNQLENTLIMFVSDHGDMLGDHHLWRKTYAYEGSARIPFLVRWPEGMTDASRGQVRHEPVELRDVLPTFLDAAGIGGGEGMEGRNILPLLSGTNTGWREYIDLEHDICYDKKNHWSALTDGNMKYIFHALDGEEMLFDLNQDPGECVNLATKQEFADVLATWRQRLVQHLRERGEAWVKNGQLQLRPESILYSPYYPQSTG